MDAVPYTGGVVLRDYDGTKVGHIEVRGSGTGVQMSVTFGGSPTTTSVLVDLFEDEQVEDLGLAFRDALARAREMRDEMALWASGGPS